MVHPERITMLNHPSFTGGTRVVYWMQQAQRIRDNHALGLAIEEANKRSLQLVVVFVITDTFPDANLRHYHFMLGGLAEIQAGLEKRGVRMIVLRGNPSDALAAFVEDAALLITDCGYLRVQKQWRASLAIRLKCPMIQVETDVIVPATAASPKEEYSAGTIRPKLHRRYREFMTGVKIPQVKRDSLNVQVASVKLENIDRLCGMLKIDTSVAPVKWLSPGESAAESVLENFIDKRLDHFTDLRNDPSLDYLSNLSPYLHFGQISPLRIARRVMAAGSKSADAFIEELFVRRELAMNFVHYNPAYDTFLCLPKWARASLDEHRNDARDYHYSVKQFENAQTHDPYWNAAQMEMVKRGKMHGYMRMYWGKKILEWSRTPETAFVTALKLNNKYSLDGRDPNGFAGVAWCFGKHDRAWSERPVFGKVRYMNDNGLKRKFNIDQYVRNVERLGEK